MNTALERKLIENFIIKEKKERYLQFIEKENTRKKFLKELYHFKDLNWKLFEEIPGNKDSMQAIMEKLANKKINCAYVVSVNDILDAKEIFLAEADFETTFTEGSILIFGEAEVVYYEGEGPNNRFISK